MRILLVLLALSAAAIALPAAAQPGPLVICNASGRNCRSGELSDVAARGDTFELKRQIDPSTVDSIMPVAITLIAMADSEIFWNGAPLARNGDPYGAGRSGRFVFTVIVPGDRIRRDYNLVVVRMKRPYEILPVAQPVHEFSIGPYVDPRLDTLIGYLPALLMGGALGAAALWFGIAFALDRTERGARLLALAAAGAVVQLGLEATRAFIPYLHIWQPLRLAAIAVLGAFVGTMFARYAAWRFVPAIRNQVTLTCAVGSCLILVLAPGFDLKALAAFVLCMMVIAGLAAQALGRGVLSASLALIGTLGTLAWIAHDGVQFLDRGYYLALGCIFMVLAIEQARSIRRRADPAIAAPERPEPPTLWRMVTGTRIQLEPISMIVVLTAADDYTEVRFVDGRTGLHTANLSQSVLSSGGHFVRVHRSYAVNRHAVKASAPRPGGGLCLTVEGGAIVPVGRTFQQSVQAEFGLNE